MTTQQNINQKMKPLMELFPELTIPKKVVITMHQAPDADAMGSSLGLYHFLIQLGHTVTVVSPTNWPDFLDWMPGCNLALNYENNLQKEAIHEAIEKADWLFCLDFNAISIYRVKHLETVIKAATCTRILIDHHQQPKVESFHYGISDTAKSSTSEMIYDAIIESGHSDKINIPMMECLYAGVMGDTGSFRYASATESVHNMIAYMKSRGLNHTAVHDNIYDNSSVNQLLFLGHVLSNRMQIFQEYNTVLITISKADFLKYNIKTGGTDGVVNYPLSIKGIKLATICIEEDDRTRLSFRSKGNFDVSTLARTHFEGGGHCNAAGGQTSLSLEKTIEKFTEVMKQNASQLQ